MKRNAESCSGVFIKRAKTEPDESHKRKGPRKFKGGRKLQTKQIRCGTPAHVAFFPQTRATKLWRSEANSHRKKQMIESNAKNICACLLKLSMNNTEAFSRLAALSKLQVVREYERIRSKVAIVVGVGGVGSVAAEMLARCAIGKLIVFDYDIVEMANMNRMFFTPDQVGMLKVDAAKDTIHKITLGQTEVIGVNGNICQVDMYEKFIATIRKNQGGNLIVLCCVDNYAARVTVNRACLETNQVWFESGVSETAMSGHIQFMNPGHSACFECAPPAIIASNGDEKNILRPGVCAASLPTTMSIIAGLLVQNALKYLLGFGTIGGCVGYEAMKDFFPVYQMRANPDCVSDACRTHQEHAALHASKDQGVSNEPCEQVTSEPEHEENSWGIEVVSEEEEVPIQNACNGNDRPELGKLSVDDLRTRLKRK
jgi:ubiquitin-like modifier-activating enzyme 5